jgi:hypothetical protein
MFVENSAIPLSTFLYSVVYFSKNLKRTVFLLKILKVFRFNKSEAFPNHAAVSLARLNYGILQ